MALHASRMDTVRIHKRLEEVLKPMGDKFWIYPEGMTDASIADELKVGKSSVMGVRTECFGLLFRQAAPGKTSQLAEVQLALRNLQVNYEEVKLKQNLLIDLLVRDKIVDCRHLAIKPVRAGGVA